MTKKHRDQLEDDMRSDPARQVARIIPKKIETP